MKATLDEWLSLLNTQTPARLAALIVRDDDRMTRLRQSLPFLEALTASERREVEAALGEAPEPLRRP